MKKIQKLKINLFPDELKDEYEKAKTKYIAEYSEWVPGGFFTSGHYKHCPDVGLAMWNKSFPNGFDDWSNSQRVLTSSGQQRLIEKINEIITQLNEDKK